MIWALFVLARVTFWVLELMAEALILIFTAAIWVVRAVVLFITVLLEVRAERRRDCR